MTGYIYSLQKRDSLFYIGCTFNPPIRENTHLSNYRKEDTNVSFEILDFVEVENMAQLFYWERYWIDQIRQWGFPIINYTNNLSKKRAKKDKTNTIEFINKTALKFDQKSFAKAIRYKRSIELNIDLRLAASMIGLHFSTLSRLENGQIPDLETYANVCEWLEVDMETFFHK